MELFCYVNYIEAYVSFENRIVSLIINDVVYVSYNLRDFYIFDISLSFLIIFVYLERNRGERNAIILAEISVK